MEKVYLVIVEDIVDYADYSPNPKAYKSLESAKKEFKDTVDAFKAEYLNESDDNIVIEESDTCFEYYAEGWYPQNHYVVKIWELDVMD